MTRRIDPFAAYRAVEAATESGEELARRSATPGWYHPALGFSLFLPFGAVSLGWHWIPYGVILGLLVVPIVVNMIAGHVTGIRLDRWSATRGTRRIAVKLAAVSTVLIVVGLCLEWGLDVRGGAALAGAAVLVATVVGGRHVDVALTRDLARPA